MKQVKEILEIISGNEPVYISADNTDIRVVQPVGKKFTIKELYKLLDIDMIQIIELYDNRLLIIDEEGKLKDEVIVNKIATELFRINRMSEQEVKELGKKYEAEGFGFVSTFDSDL